MQDLLLGLERAPWRSDLLSLGDFALFDSALPAVAIYALITVPFFCVFWVWRRQAVQPRRIQPKQRSTAAQWTREIRQSLSSVAIFTLIDVGIFLADRSGFTTIYQSIDDHGLAYLAASVVLMIVIQDTFFYWAHRLMHWKPLYRWSHRVHHESIDTSPFTAYSFSLVEAVVEGIPNIIFPFLFPVHWSALIVYQVLSLIMNVIGHLGYEIIPESWSGHWLLKWKTPSTHHNMHHSHVNGNYTLYFRFWDVWMGTEFKEYPQKLQTVYERIRQHRQAAEESATPDVQLQLTVPSTSASIPETAA